MDDNKIEMNNILFHNFLEYTKSRIFKILPLFEEKNAGVFKHINSLLFDFYGLQYVINGLEKSAYYISILSGLEALLDESLVGEKDIDFIRSKVLRMVTLIGKIQGGELE